MARTSSTSSGSGGGKRPCKAPYEEKAPAAIEFKPRDKSPTESSMSHKRDLMTHNTNSLYSYHSAQDHDGNPLVIDVSYGC